MGEAYLNIGWVLSELQSPNEAVRAYTHGLRLGSWPAQTKATVHNK